MCMICKSEAETRYFDLYVFGSEGLHICHECEMELVGFVRDLRRSKMRLPIPRAGDGLESEQICMCDIQGSFNCAIHGSNRRA